MSQDEIKNRCELMYRRIKNAEDTLKELRSICKHPNTFEGNWSYRVGSTLPATICADCGECLKINLE